MATVIRNGEKTPAEQVRELGFSSVQAKSSILLRLLAPVGTGSPSEDMKAPSGKGDGELVQLAGAYMAFEVDKDGNPKSTKFGSPRAIDFVEASLRQISPYIWENPTVKTMFVVPEITKGDLVIVTRENQEQTPETGDYLSVDNRGFLNVVKAEKFRESYTLLS
jgi:hypothetical protein